MWKKSIDSEDLRIYERSTKDVKARIECRKVNPSEWKVFKTYFNNAINYTEEYDANSAEECGMLMNELLKEKLLSLEQIKKTKKAQLKAPKIEIKRSYKEDNVEKWLFSIDNGLFENFFILREYESLELDIIVNDKYRPFEKRIIEEINKILSLDNTDIDVTENIYFFRKRSKHNIKPNMPTYLYSRIESDFDE